MCKHAHTCVHTHFNLSKENFPFPPSTPPFSFLPFVLVQICQCLLSTKHPYQVPVTQNKATGAFPDDALPSIMRKEHLNNKELEIAIVIDKKEMN